MHVDVALARERRRRRVARRDGHAHSFTPPTPLHSTPLLAPHLLLLCSYLKRRCRRRMLAITGASRQTPIPNPLPSLPHRPASKLRPPEYSTSTVPTCERMQSTPVSHLPARLPSESNHICRSEQVFPRGNGRIVDRGFRSSQTRTFVPSLLVSPRSMYST